MSSQTIFENVFTIEGMAQRDEAGAAACGSPSKET